MLLKPASSSPTSLASSTGTRASKSPSSTRPIAPRTARTGSATERAAISVRQKAHHEPGHREEEGGQHESCSR